MNCHIMAQDIISSLKSICFKGPATEENPRAGDPQRRLPARGRPDRRDEGGRRVGAGQLQGPAGEGGRVLTVPRPVLGW